MGLHEEISELEQRFAESPDSRLFLPLADALRRAGELERAEKLCRDGLERFPDFNSARILLGECLADMGKLEQAGQILSESAELDSGNRRIADRLADIESQKGGGAQPSDTTAETGAPETEADAVEGGAPEAAEPEEAAPAGDASKSGGMFVTDTLGDIYKLQGHDRKAFEIYSKLAAGGQAGPEVKEKLRELSEKLGKVPIAGDISGDRAEGDAVLEMARVESGEGRFEERIDTIFHFLLGDSPDHSESERQSSSAAQPVSSNTEPGDSGEFVDMLEDWIEDIRQEK
jgi:tetratricopeptide (TPR) repeat protein